MVTKATTRSIIQLALVFMVLSSLLLPDDTAAPVLILIWIRGLARLLSLWRGLAAELLPCLGI